MLEELGPVRPGRRGFSEGVEVDRDEVDRLDARLLELIEVRGVVAAREERRVDLRVQRLHATAEERGRAGDVLDRARADALRGQRGARSVGGDELPAEVAQAAREHVETSAVRDGEESPQRHLV